MMGIGELLSLLSALTWAIGVMLYRQLGQTLPPVQLNQIKNLLVLGMTTVAALLLAGPFPQLDPAALGITLLSGFLGVAIGDTLYFRALNQLGAGRMGVLSNFYSPTVIVLGYLFLDERLTLIQLVGFSLVMFGVLLVAERRADDGRKRDLAKGIAIGITAIALMAVAIVLVKRLLEQHDLLWMTWIRLMGAVAGLFVIAVWANGRSALTPWRAALPWKKLLIAAFVGQFLSMLCWLGGYKFTSASVAAILNESTSVFILLLAWWWLKEPLTRRGIVGVVLTISGVACMLVPT